MIKIANDRTGRRQSLHYHFDGIEWRQEWEEKFDASKVVVAEQLQKLETVRQQVLKRELSPIAYYAQERLLNVKTLSFYTGIPKRHIRKHMKPEYFSQLTEDTLKVYAEAFKISIEKFNEI